MRWPFKSKKETDIRVFRDPETDALILRLVGPVCLPSSENPVVSFSLQMDVKLDQEAIQRLYLQLSHFAARETSAAQ